MRTSVQLSQAEIEDVLAKWLMAEKPGIKPITAKNVYVEIHQGDDDPRGPHSEYVTASISFEE